MLNVIDTVSPTLAMDSSSICFCFFICVCCQKTPCAIRFFLCCLEWVELQRKRKTLFCVSSLSLIEHCDRVAYSASSFHFCRCVTSLLSSCSLCFVFPSGLVQLKFTRTHFLTYPQRCPVKVATNLPRCWSVKCQRVVLGIPFTFQDLEPSTESVSVLLMQHIFHQWIYCWWSQQ